MNSLDYILRYFLTIDQVANQSGVPVDKLAEFEKAGCLPGPAYRVEGSAKINSVFGDHDESLHGGYYPHSHVVKARELDEFEGTLEELAIHLKRDFLTAYRDQLVKMRAQDFGLAHLFDENGLVSGEAAEKLLEEEWAHYMKGTYGLCTRTAMVEDIAAKEIMVSKIKFLTEKLDGDVGNRETLLAQLERSVNLLDSVSMPFAPHEFERSSRMQYVDNIRTAYLTLVEE